MTLEQEVKLAAKHAAEKAAKEAAEKGYEKGYKEACEKFDVRARRFQPHLSPARIAKNKFN